MWSSRLIVMVLLKLRYKKIAGWINRYCSFVPWSVNESARSVNWGEAWVGLKGKSFLGGIVGVHPLPVKEYGARPKGGKEEKRRS